MSASSASAPAAPGPPPNDSPPPRCPHCRAPNPPKCFTCPKCPAGNNRHHVCDESCSKKFWKLHKSDHVVEEYKQTLDGLTLLSEKRKIFAEMRQSRDAQTVLVGLLLQAQAALNGGYEEEAREMRKLLKLHGKMMEEKGRGMRASISLELCEFLANMAFCVDRDFEKAQNILYGFREHFSHTGSEACAGSVQKHMERMEKLHAQLEGDSSSGAEDGLPPDQWLEREKYDLEAMLTKEDRWTVLGRYLGQVLAYCGRGRFLDAIAVAVAGEALAVAAVGDPRGADGSWETESEKSAVCVFYRQWYCVLALQAFERNDSKPLEEMGGRVLRRFCETHELAFGVGADVIGADCAICGEAKVVQDCSGGKEAGAGQSGEVGKAGAVEKGCDEEGGGPEDGKSGGSGASSAVGSRVQSEGCAMAKKNEDAPATTVGSSATVIDKGAPPVLSILNCNHSFHVGCFKQWAAEKWTPLFGGGAECPLCRRVG